MVAEAQQPRPSKLVDTVSGVVSRHRDCARDVRGLGVVGRIHSGARAGQRGRRAHHRVPVRARAGDAAGVIMVATGKGATAGIIFRNTEAIEVMRKVDTLVVDKTGTLTRGSLAS